MDVEAATKESEAWRAKHEADYRREWATIAGLHFLEPGMHTAGSAPSNDIVLPASAPLVMGRFVLENDVVIGSVNANLSHYRSAAAALTDADLTWLERLVSRRVPLASFHDAFESREDDVKVVITLGD